MGLRELYKGIQRKPTREETYLIKGLLVDAGKAEHNAAFVKLGLKPMLDQLKAINEDDCLPGSISSSKHLDSGEGASQAIGSVL